ENAIAYAKRAVGIEPMEGNYWNTLGVAYYRAGELEEAKNALYRSMELRGEGDGFDWFFLALVHFKLGHKDRAREWYGRATGRSQQVQQFGGSLPASQVDELFRFQVEAAEVMGLPKPAPNLTRARDAMWWTGAEVIGVPIPFAPAALGAWSQSQDSVLFGAQSRVEPRVP